MSVDDALHDDVRADSGGGVRKSLFFTTTFVVQLDFVIFLNTFFI